jgi:hypothetical protein
VRLAAIAATGAIVIEARNFRRSIVFLKEGLQKNGKIVFANVAHSTVDFKAKERNPVR